MFTTQLWMLGSRQSCYLTNINITTIEFVQIIFKCNFGIFTKFVSTRCMGPPMHCQSHTHTHTQWTHILPLRACLVDNLCNLRYPIIINIRLAIVVCHLHEYHQYFLILSWYDCFMISPHQLLFNTFNQKHMQINRIHRFSQWWTKIKFDVTSKC